MQAARQALTLTLPNHQVLEAKPKLPQGNCTVSIGSVLLQEEFVKRDHNLKPPICERPFTTTCASLQLLHEDSSRVYRESCPTLAVTNTNRRTKADHHSTARALQERQGAQLSLDLLGMD